jgi:hypothetical protein
MRFHETTKEERLALVEDTWEKLGRKIRGNHKHVWVRTLPFATMTAGGIHLPPKLASFHGEVSAHLVTVRAVVLSPGTVGVAKDFEPGDVVEFQRLQFGYIEKLDRETQEYVGFLDANQILWKIEMDSDSDSETAAA